MMGNRQNKKWAFFLLVLVFSLAAGCGGDESADAVKKPQANRKTAAYDTLRIVFKWPGDDFATLQDLAVRDQIGGLIRDRSVGKVIRAGTGMGWMDILVQVEDKADAIPELKSIIKETGTELNFCIEDTARPS